MDNNDIKVRWSKRLLAWLAWMLPVYAGVVQYFRSGDLELIKLIKTEALWVTIAYVFAETLRTSGHITTLLDKLSGLFQKGK